MGTTPVGQVTAAGFVRPDFAYVLNYGQTNVRAIYGSDVWLGADSQDGQLVALEQQGVYDTSGVALAVYNAFSPATAVGTGLDRVVKINGIARKRATYSTAPLRIVGQVGLVVTNGSISDPAGNVWVFPSSFQIPSAGEITVAITCQTRGAITLAAGSIDTDSGKGAFSTSTIQEGLQSAVTTAAASPGRPVETDNALRQRQSISTALPSLRLQDGLAGALAAISGVNRLKVYNNDKRTRDVNGIPGGTIACVVDGGDPATIAAVIELKKGPGPSTFGTTVVTVPPPDTRTIPQDVAFFYLTQVPVRYAVTVQNLGGYTASIEGIWTAALAAFVNGLDIGEDVQRDQAFAAAKNYDGQGSKTFRIVSFAQSRDGAVPAPADVPIAFYEAATCDPANIVVTVLPQAS